MLYACVKVLLPLSLVVFAGTAVWIWAVPQPAGATASDGRILMNLGHLVSKKEWIQLTTPTSMGLSAVGLVLLNLYGTLIFVLKVFTIIFIQIWLRWTLPRIRIDQVMYTCVKVLLPLSLVVFAGTAVWIWAVPDRDPNDPGSHHQADRGQ